MNRYKYCINFIRIDEHAYGVGRKLVSTERLDTRDRRRQNSFSVIKKDLRTFEALFFCFLDK